jgi:ABC-type antimicrobial peptide transport system permease subunit
MSYEVSRRTHEIGIRLAIGANAGDVVRMVMRETILLVFIGVSIGVLCSLLTGKYVSSMLFGLVPNDPATIAVAVLSLCSVAALAGYIPARRASRVDPMVALRYE